MLSRPRATIADAAAAATVILLGPDLKQELPVLHLRLRDAASKKRTRIIEFTSTGSGLTSLAWRSIRHAPGTVADSVAAALAEPEIAAQLAAGPVVVVAGRADLAESPAFTMAALDRIMAAVPGATVLPALRRGNVVGALVNGLAPASPSDEATAVLRDAAEGRLEVLILLGADPLVDHPDVELARRALAGAGRIIAIDGHLSTSSREADVILPAAIMAEKSGTTTNLEGRVSPVEQKVTVHGTARPDWMIAVELAAMLGHDLGVGSVEEITARLAAAPIAAAPVGDTVSAVPLSGYDMRLIVSRVLYDQAVSTAQSPSLVGLAAGAGVLVHPLDLERLGVPSGSAVRVTSGRGSVVMSVCADERLQRQTAWAPFAQPSLDGVSGDIREVIDAASPVTDVRIERL